MLDGSDYKGHKIKVEKAKFELKGSYDASKHVIKEAGLKKLNKNKEKKLLEKQRQKYALIYLNFYFVSSFFIFLFFRLLDWEERPDIVRQKHEKVVVIKNIFTLNDINVSI